jgi:uncharacterized SAM-binding protein YcdF (DUF218 family)
VARWGELFDTAGIGRPTRLFRPGRLLGSGRRRLAAGALAALMLVTAGLTARWIVWPAGVVERPAPADAVVVFGGSGRRHEQGVRLVEAGTAPWLVVSDPRADDQVWTAYGLFCQGEHAFRTVCFDPEPETTRGEARFVADLARRQGWRRIVVVTDTEQARRAGQLVSRCWEGDVDVVTVPSGRARPLRIVYEAAANIRAAIFRRGC